MSCVIRRGRDILHHMSEPCNLLGLWKGWQPTSGHTPRVMSTCAFRSLHLHSCPHSHSCSNLSLPLTPSTPLAPQDIEEALVKRDIKRQKLAEAKNVPGLVARVNEMNSTALRRRTKMMLPAPQVRFCGDVFVGVLCAAAPAGRV